MQEEQVDERELEEPRLDLELEELGLGVGG